MVKIFSYILISIVTIVIIYYLVMMLITKSIRNDMAATKEAILDTKHICPEGSHEVIERWSEVGYAWYCVKDNEKHGQWMAWEKQRLHIVGNYQYGKKHGRWTVYNDDGSIYRITEYDNGHVIRDNRPGSNKEKDWGHHN